MLICVYTKWRYIYIKRKHRRGGTTYTGNINRELKIVQKATTKGNRVKERTPSKGQPKTHRISQGITVHKSLWIDTVRKATGLLMGKMSTRIAICQEDTLNLELIFSLPSGFLC